MGDMKSGTKIFDPNFSGEVEMNRKERIADLEKQIAEWDPPRLGMTGLRRLRFD